MELPTLVREHLDALDKDPATADKSYKLALAIERYGEECATDAANDVDHDDVFCPWEESAASEKVSRWLAFRRLNTNLSPDTVREFEQLIQDLDQ